MKTIKGPALFLAQFAGDEAPFNSWDSITKWAADCGYKGVQVPSWDARLIDLDKAAASKGYCEDWAGQARANGVEVTELSTHLQGQLVAVHPAYDDAFDGFGAPEVRGNPKARQQWAVSQVKMALSASKRLAVEHRLMREGEFNQFVTTKKIAGATCGILGYGETGREVARLMRALGMNIRAINRSGQTDEDVALTTLTDGLIGARRLGLMKQDAVLVNVARGEILDEDDLFAHLQNNPAFTACLDAWWIEPVRHGRFRTKHPFLDLPNVIASPRNSAMTEGALVMAAQRGAANVARFLTGGTPKFIAGDDVRMV